MGKGDRKSRRGKLCRGTFGKRRLQKTKKAAPAVKAPRPSEA
jgi:ribosomal small subunit protein bTHX